MQCFLSITLVLTISTTWKEKPITNGAGQKLQMDAS